MTILISCRLAEKKDLPEILRLYAQPEIDNGRVLSLQNAESIFERINNYPDYTLYVADSEGVIVGTFSLLIMDNLGHLGSPSAIIEDVAVAPYHQGQGVGKVMMAHALNVAAQKGCYKAMLSSNLKRESAHQFYESLGFKKHGYSFLTDIQGVRCSAR